MKEPSSDYKFGIVASSFEVFECAMKLAMVKAPTISGWKKDEKEGWFIFYSSLPKNGGGVDKLPSYLDVKGATEFIWHSLRTAPPIGYAVDFEASHTSGFEINAFDNTYSDGELFKVRKIWVEIEK